VDGLDAIKERILFIAEDKASDIDYAAQKQIDRMLNEAEKEAGSIKLKYEESAKRECENIMRRANSLAVSDRRKIILSARQKIVEDVLQKALESMANLPEEKKKEIYLKMLENTCSGDKSETVKFNSKDKIIAAGILEKLNKPVKLIEDTGNFSGGFILYNGNIEMNMTFDMTIHHYRSELISIAANTLFKNQDELK